MTPVLFQSFLMGGFECSSHRDMSGRRLDLVSSTQHDRFALRDYQRLADNGILTARDGVRWHLIETKPFHYEFSSLEAQVAAAREAGVQIIWDLFHYGFPDDLDMFSNGFPERFCQFAIAVCKYLAEQLGPNIVVCPVNEISFFSWIAGKKGMFAPFRKGKAPELKHVLIECGIKASAAIRRMLPEAKIMFTDPAIHVVPRENTAAARRAAESYRLAQFEAFDALFKEDPESTNIIGLNYYFHNQWRHPSRRKIPRGHREYRPFREIIAEYYERYKKPILVAETGIEDDERPDWFRYVCDEVAAARELGIPVVGICLYPIVNHPGWADDRHCHNGLWDYADETGHRDPYLPLLNEFHRQSPRFA